MAKAHSYPDKIKGNSQGLDSMTISTINKDGEPRHNQKSSTGEAKTRKTNKAESSEEP